MHQGHHPNPETGQELPASAAELREDYRRAVATAIEEWSHALAADGMDYVVIETDRPLSLAVRHYLRRRAQLR